MVFSLNSVRFFFSYNQIEALGGKDARLGSILFRRLLCTFYRWKSTPLAGRDLYKFAKKNLIVFAYAQTLFTVMEVFATSLNILQLAHVFG